MACFVLKYLHSYQEGGSSVLHNHVTCMETIVTQEAVIFGKMVMLGGIH